MTNEEREFWDRAAGYERRFTSEDFRGAAVATALGLRREAEDMLADLSDWAAYAGDTEEDEDYVRWIQRVGDDVSSRIALALASAPTMDEAEQHLSFAYIILREVARDALSRRPA